MCKIKVYKKNFIFIIILFCISFLANFTIPPHKINCLGKTNSKNIYCNPKREVSLVDDLEQDLTDNIEEQLKDIDFSNLDSIVNGLQEGEKNLFGANSFLGLVKSFIYGENLDLHNNFFSYILSTLFKSAVSLLPYFATIVAIAIIYSLLSQFGNNSKVSAKNVVHIVCFASIALIVVKIIVSLLTSTTLVISSIASQTEFLFPILLTLITALGGTVTASTFQPVLATFSVLIIKIFTNILIPVFIFSFVFNIVGNISNNVKLEKFSKFFSSFFNWSVGIIFTIFIAFLAIQGLTVSSIDGISIKTAKYALKSYIPILGSYLSDGVGLILTSTSLIKNSVGVTGLVLLVSTIIGPILNIIVTMLLFKLVSALLEPLSDNKISNFLFSVSKSLSLLNTILIAIGFMYLISTSMLMIVSNIF